MKLQAAALLVVPFVSFGCGGGDDPTTPTTPTVRSFPYEVIVEGPLAAHASYCTDFEPEVSGSAYANAGFPAAIELGAGRCAGTRSVIARNDTGEVTATLPAGNSYVRFENASDSNTRFRLQLRYLKRY